MGTSLTSDESRPDTSQYQQMAPADRKHQTPMQLSVPKMKIPKRQQTREELHIYAERFFGDSQLHGFREAYFAKTKWTRSFWVTVCMVCGVAALSQVYATVMAYINGSVATQISIVNEVDMKYPTLLICPTEWINQSAMDENNMSEATVEFFRHYMQLEMDHPNDHCEKDVNPKVCAKRFKKARDEIDKALLKFKRMDWLFLNLTVKAPAVTCTNHSRPVKPTVTRQGVCFIVWLCRGGIAVSPKVEYSIQKHKVASIENRLHPGLRVDIYSCRKGIGPHMYNPVLFAPAATQSQITVTMTKYVKIATKLKPCDHRKGIDFVSGAFNIEKFVLHACMKFNCKYCCYTSVFDSKISIIFDASKILCRRFL